MGLGRLHAVTMMINAMNLKNAAKILMFMRAMPESVANPLVIILGVTARVNA